MLRMCLTRNRAHFPDCNRDPAAMKRSVAAGEGGVVHFSGIAPGSYALAVIHDEDGDGRLDKFMMVPREGFGFSRNPHLRMGPPTFDEVRFPVGNGSVEQTVRLRYLL